MKEDPFKEYRKEQEPSKRERYYLWRTAIGLQAVDGLKPSEYLISLAKKNIDSDISMEEVEALIDSYYKEKQEKADIGERKLDIQSQKVDIGETKLDIRKDFQQKLEALKPSISNKTIEYILLLFNECGTEKIFGRKIVENLTGLKSSRASEIIKLLLDNNFIKNVKGQGKGKYRFFM